MFVKKRLKDCHKSTMFSLFVACVISFSFASSTALADTTQGASDSLINKPIRHKDSFKERLQKRKALAEQSNQMPANAEMSMQHDHQDMPSSMTMPINQEAMTMEHEQHIDAKAVPRFWDSMQDSMQSEQEPMHQHMHEKTVLTPETPSPSIFKPIKHTMPSISGDDSGSDGVNKYVCPMHPQIVRDSQGSCPICGMDLVTHKTQSGDVKNPQVFLTTSVIQNMGVRIAPARKNQLHNHIATQGLVSADEDRVVNIHPRTAGWIQRLYPLTEGDRVERKDTLVDFYSPWINEIQLQYIAALEEFDMLSFAPEKAQEINSKVDSLTNSLRLLNVMDMDIMRIRNTRKVQNTIQLLAPLSGVITDLNIREGTYLEPYQSMFTIVDLSKVWVMIDIYEHQAVSVRKGQQVSITTPAIPSRKWQATIDYIYPEVNPETRTLKARITLDNPDEALLLNMYVNVDIAVNHSNHEVLTVPREAVILTGEREVVIKALGNGHFQPFDVKTGLRDNDNIEIISGLSEHDEVVISGQFLIDSESSLQASFLRLSQ